MNVEQLDLPSASVLDGLGERIRALRTQRNMTLLELSAQCQVSVAMLSHIELNRSTPSIKVLDRIRHGLGVPFGLLFEENPQNNIETEVQVVMKRDKRPLLRFDATGLVKELLSPVRGTQLEMMLLRLQPNGYSGDEPWRRIGEKCGFVLNGSFELTIGSSAYILYEGDAFQFDSSAPHTFKNTYDGESVIMWIILSREFG